MRIKMTSTQTGSVDGIRASGYVEGEEYDLTHTEGERDLARVFVQEGWATEVDGKKQPKQSEAIAEDGAASNEVPPITGKKGKK